MRTIRQRLERLEQARQGQCDPAELVLGSSEDRHLPLTGFECNGVTYELQQGESEEELKRRIKREHPGVFILLEEIRDGVSFRERHECEVSGGGPEHGVLVTPRPMSVEEWQELAREQQRELFEMEKHGR